MIEKLIKYAGLIPLVAVIIYIAGYLSLSAYLQSYGINESIGLDFRILRMGVLFAIIAAPVVLLAYADFRFNDYTNAEPDVSLQLITNLTDALGYSLLYSLVLVNLFLKFQIDRPTVLILILLLLGFILNKTASKIKWIKLIKGVFIMVPFFTFAFLSIQWPVTARSTLYFLQISIYTTCACLRIFNKSGLTYQMSKIGAMVTTLFYSATLFGVFIVGHIKSEQGGQMSRDVVFFVTSEAIPKIKNTDIIKYLTPTNQLKVEMLYEGNDLYYFKIGTDKIIAFPKTYFAGQEITIPSVYSR